MLKPEINPSAQSLRAAVLTIAAALTGRKADVSCTDCGPAAPLTPYFSMWQMVNNRQVLKVLPSSFPGPDSLNN